MFLKNIMLRIARYFLRGLLYLAPLVVTGIVFYKTFIVIDGLFPFKIPGLGLLATLGVIFIVGLIGSSILVSPILGLLDDLLSKAPLVKIIYTSIKDFLEAFMGEKKKFTEPVLVKIYENSELMRIGFVTSRDLSHLGLDNSYVSVYFPDSYNFAGMLFIAPVKSIIPVQGASTDLMKFIITAGVAEMPTGSKDEITNL
ncbi:MAG: DUF502 domain-containing protein [Bacteroidota bacterium]